MSKSNFTGSPAEGSEPACVFSAIVSAEEPTDEASVRLLSSVLELGAVVGVAHLTPVLCAESAVNTCPSEPTANRAGVDAAVAAYRSPLVVSVDLRVSHLIEFELQK